MQAETRERNLVREGDLIVDIDTGEIIGHVDPTFRVCDQASAEWVLQRIQQDEIDMAALELTKKALLANVNAMIADKQRHRDGLIFRFKDELEAWAKSELEGAKVRHVKTLYGRLKFTHKNPRVVVVDEDRAIEAAAGYEPEAVKVTRSFLVSKLPAHMVKLSRETLLGLGLDVEPEADVFAIETGIKAVSS